jgi:hypothetical protein
MQIIKQLISLRSVRFKGRTGAKGVEEGIYLQLVNPNLIPKLQFTRVQDDLRITCLIISSQNSTDKYICIFKAYMRLIFLFIVSP